MRFRFTLIALFALVAANWAAFARPELAMQEPPQPQPIDSLNGTWDLVSLIENGQPIPSTIVKQTMIANGRVVISGQLLAFDKPDGTVKTLAFVADPTVSPKHIDLAGAVNLGSKGIYMRDGDTLLICFSTSESASRPTEFVSLPGKNTVMMTFTKTVNPPPAPAIKPAPPPPAPVFKSTDADLTAALIGTWGHQTDDKIVKFTLNPGGSFSSVVTYKKGFKKVFDDEERASGTWKVLDGTTIFTTTASSVRGQVGQVASYRVTTINSGEVIYVDNQTGGRRIEWKLR